MNELRVLAVFMSIVFAIVLFTILVREWESKMEARQRGMNKK